MRRLVLVLALLFALPAFAQSPLETLLPDWWKEAAAKAERVPEEQRMAVQRSLVFAEEEKSEDQIRTMLYVIALRPQDVRGSQFARQEAYRYRADASPDDQQEDAKAVADFLEQVYRRHAGIDSDAAVQWQAGLAEMVFSQGRYEEGLALQRQVVAVNDHAYKRLLLAVMEKVNGNDEAFARTMADCPEDPEKRWPKDEYCWNVVRSIAGRTARVSPNAEKILDDLIAGRGVAAVQPWEERMHGLTSLAGNDSLKARKELEAVLIAPDAPKYVKDDALYLLIQLGASGKDETTLSQIDCFLERRGLVFPPFPENGWEALRTLMAAQKEPMPDIDWHGCLQHDAKAELALDVRHPCVATLLQRQAMYAANVGDAAVARQAAERAVAISLAQGKPVSWLSMTLQHAAGGNFHDARAMQYVASLPRNGFIPIIDDQMNKAVREQTRRVETPWDSPVKAPSRAANCPR